MVTAVIEPRWIDNIDTHQHLLPTHNEVDGHLLQTRNSPPLPRSLGLWVQCSRARKRGCVPVRPGQREVRYSLNYRFVDIEDKYVWSANFHSIPLPLCGRLRRAALRFWGIRQVH
jgi:hypothetical protein